MKERYLARIGATSSDLRELHRRHLFTVPFENLDIGNGRPIAIDEDAFVRKIVDERRGGFCYELNGAFAWLLRALGHDVKLLDARVPRPDGTLGPHFDHMTLLVDGEWLCDVGFGDCFLEPLRIDAADEQHDPAGTFRIRDGILEKKAGDAWETEFVFTRDEHPLADFAGMCRFHQTSPESHFTRGRLCSLATADGRVTLRDLRLIETHHGAKTERVLANEDEARDVLRERFGIVQ